MVLSGECLHGEKTTVHKVIVIDLIVIKRCGEVQRKLIFLNEKEWEDCNGLE